MFAAKKQLSQVAQKLNAVDNSHVELASLNQEIKGINNAIGGQTKVPEDVAQELLDFISKTALNIDIVAIEDVHIATSDEFLVYTNQVTLQGDYEILLKLLYRIELKFKNSRIMNSQFYTKKNYRTNKNILYLKIILQNYEKSK